MLGVSKGYDRDGCTIYCAPLDFASHPPLLLPPSPLHPPAILPLAPPCTHSGVARSGATLWPHTTPHCPAVGSNCVPHHLPLTSPPPVVNKISTPHFLPSRRRYGREERGSGAERKSCGGQGRGCSGTWSGKGVVGNRGSGTKGGLGRKDSDVNGGYGVGLGDGGKSPTLCQPRVLLGGGGGGGHRPPLGALHGEAA